MDFDAIVIGAGQAGPSLAVRLARSARKTAIVERKLLGGTCVNVGCIPAKTLIASARVAHVSRTASDYGVAVRGDIHVDMARVKARKDVVVRQSFEGLRKWLLVHAESERFLGAALLGVERDEVIHAIADLMYARAVHDHAARRARASDCVRAPSYAARRAGAAGVKLGALVNSRRRQ
jgi:pyruvate/2-oxoglutarate dehydrogenase complex dihydrolipoamide dehydrogenase (E3) component